MVVMPWDAVTMPLLSVGSVSVGRVSAGDVVSVGVVIVSQGANSGMSKLAMALLRADVAAGGTGLNGRG
jgi:hypothetical protein